MAEFYLKSNDFVQAAHFFFFVDVVRQMARGESARAFGIFEHKGLVERTFAHEGEGLGVIVESFAMEATEDVGADSGIGKDASDGSDAVEIPFACVFAIHAFEDGIATALHRKVDESTEIRVAADGFECGIAHVFWM